MFNINALQSNNARDISLDNIAIMAQAQVEFDGGMLPGVTVWGSRTFNARSQSAQNGIGSAKILLTRIWFSDDRNPTPQEIQRMNQDLAMSRSEQYRTFTHTPSSSTFELALNMRVISPAVDWRHPITQVSVSMHCCGFDLFGSCTHNPPCEALPNALFPRG